MMKKNAIALSLGLAVASLSVQASTFSADGRSNGMGNIGVATADYLAAPFYNPALTALYHGSDDFGVLIPAIGVNANDPDSSIDTIDNLQDAIDSLNAGNLSAQADINRLLVELNGKAPLVVNGALGLAVAIPNKTIAANLYLKGYVEVAAQTDVDLTDYEKTFIDLVAFSYSEFGLALAKQYTISEQTFSFGVTPKLQQFTTYIQREQIAKFDLDEYDQNETTDSAFNLDAGAVWMKDNYRIGFTLQNMLKQSITTQTVNGRQFTYELTPQAKIGAAYATQSITVGVDLDLTTQKRYNELNDNTQFLRVGAEGNAWDWAQLRVGYEHDLEDTLDGAFTAGLGFSPFNVFNIDIAGSYAGENQLGGSANISFTF